MSASRARLYHRLQLAAHRVQKSADRATLAAAQITTAQSAVLAVLTSGQYVTQRDIAGRLGINESAMTGMVGRLLRMKLIERQRDDADERAWRLTLNQRGRAALKRIEKPFTNINRTLESVLEPDEIAHLADYLTRISDAFG